MVVVGLHHPSCQEAFRIVARPDNTGTDSVNLSNIEHGRTFAPRDTPEPSPAWSTSSLSTSSFDSRSQPVLT